MIIELLGNCGGIKGKQQHIAIIVVYTDGMYNFFFYKRSRMVNSIKAKDKRAAVCF